MILVLLLSSCSRRREEARTPPRTPAVQEAVSPAGRTESSPQPAGAPALPPLTPARQEHVMLPLGRRTRALPEDFEIGLLEDRLGGYREQAELLALAGGFLDDLTRAGVRSEALLPESAPALVRHISFYLDRDLVPTDYRLGAVLFFPSSGAAREARLGIRLFKLEPGAPARTASAGVLYLEKQQDRWLITDLQIDFQALGAPPVREAQKFMPSSYRWLAGGS